MQKRFIHSAYFAFLIALTIASCASDEVQAEESLEGIWDVVSITSYYGTFSETTFDASETVTESGQLGTFEFLEDAVTYSFTRNDTSFTGDASWILDLEKVRSGFSRENEFTLTVADQFLFDVAFEDETRNAERDATTATFIEIPIEEVDLLIKLSLEKR